jgi:type VI secretion system protein ImpI/type VI secretion system protein
LRCPESAAPETRQIAGGEFSIGRGPENQWVLFDPERHLSKRHCILGFRSGQWQLADVSSNGTFFNSETKPIGPGAPRKVRSGDRFRLGHYEIEISIDETADVGMFPQNAPLAGPNSHRYDIQEGGRLARANPFTPSMLDPFAAEPMPSAGAWGEPDPQPGSRSDLAASSSRLPPDFDPLGDDDDDYRRPVYADHSPAISDAFRAPSPTVAIPDDWDLSSPQTFPEAPPAAAPRPPAETRQAPTAAPTPVATPAATPVAMPAPVRASPGDAGLLAAFLRGVGLPDADPPDPAATMEAVGAALRAAVSGVRQTLIARASIKGEFRIDQTLLRASGNNPIKFSPDDDDAMAALLGIGRRKAMSAERAMTEALRDVRLHELATIAAMQAAMRALLAHFAPPAVERGLEPSPLDRVPGQRKARAWDAFIAMHAKTSQALSDDFDSVFGKAFARAYEQAMEDAVATEGRQTSPSGRRR